MAPISAFCSGVKSAAATGAVHKAATALITAATKGKASDRFILFSLIPFSREAGEGRRRLLFADECGASASPPTRTLGPGRILDLVLRRRLRRERRRLAPRRLPRGFRFMEHRPVGDRFLNGGRGR